MQNRAVDLNSEKINDCQKLKTIVKFTTPVSDFNNLFEFSKNSSISNVLQSTKENQNNSLRLNFFNQFTSKLNQQSNFNKSFESSKNSSNSNLSQSTIENQNNSLRLDQFNKLTIKLIQLIKETDFEYGINSPLDIFINEKLQQNALATKDWLNTVFIRNFSDIDIITGILRTIAHIPYEEISPQGMTMSIAALSHKNPEVKECGIRTFENWGNRDSLIILKNVQVSEKWLQEYVSQVVSDLEEDLA